jgi:predicted DsbA family dithiol-disulfide isomerase
MHDVLYTRHAFWTKPRNPKDFLHAYASELGLETEAFEECYEEDHGKDRTREATRAADELDVSGTPTFLITDPGRSGP